MLNFLKSFFQPKLIRDFDQRKPEIYSWHESPLGHTYVSNINRKVLYRITKTDEGFYRVETLNNVPKVVGTFLDLDAAKKGAEKYRVDVNTWIS